MRKDLLTNKEWLEQKYIREGLTVFNISKICDCSISSVCNYLNKNNIKIKSHSESSLSKKAYLNLNNKEWLEQKYINERLSTRDLAKICKCGQTTIRRYLDKHNIKTRAYSERIMSEESKQNLSLKNKGKILSEETKKRMSESQKGRIVLEKTKQKLSKLNKGKNNPMFGKYHSKKTKQKISKKGPNHPNWQGGISYLPYCSKFNKELKEEIRENFNRKCLICGKKENGKKLSVHHIDYNKMQGCGHKWSLVPLCESCHAKTNFNRYYWFNLLNNYWLLNPEINFNSIIFIENRF